ncbi:MAG: hypothetical protein NZT92_18395, partial [Abditibacteriales bacterium]|nr:hypothetical protein [Abditibacteriales bacterium]
RRARAQVLDHPWRCTGIGAAMAIGLLIALGMTAAPNGGVKLMGLLLCFWFSAVMLVGAAGITRLMGERIEELGKPLTPFAALLRGSVIFSVALFFPIVGWLFIAPVVGMCALGAGASALLRGRREVESAKGTADSIISLDVEGTGRAQ